MIRGAGPAAAKFVNRADAKDAKFVFLCVLGVCAVLVLCTIREDM